MLELVFKGTGLRTFYDEVEYDRVITQSITAITQRAAEELARQTPAATSKLADSTEWEITVDSIGNVLGIVKQTARAQNDEGVSRPSTYRQYVSSGSVPHSPPYKALIPWVNCTSWYESKSLC
jgi:hypothetical protein